MKMTHNSSLERVTPKYTLAIFSLRSQCVTPSYNCARCHLESYFKPRNMQKNELESG